MRGLADRDRFRYGASLLAAALACLQPGIDPVFLTLLTQAHGLEPVDHGWVVGATQSGMAMGSLLVLRHGLRLPRFAFALAGALGVSASIGTARMHDAGALLLLRGLYGLAMGMIYTQAMSGASALRPNQSYAAVFLLQLILSTGGALILSALASMAGASVALLGHGAVPLLTLVAFLASARQMDGSGKPALSPAGPPPDAAAWALAAGSLLFICTTMMVWSFTGALAAAAGFAGPVLGGAVAAGSVAGAVTALCVMRGRVRLPLPLTGLLCGLGCIAPVVAIPMGTKAALYLSIVALNIGSTAIVIRCSGLAASRSPDRRFQYVVAFTHSGGLILGPALASALAAPFGMAGVSAGAGAALACGCCALLLASRMSRRPAAI